ncbi:MAG: hypothetical protein IPK74_36260 [Deltaproteobacteria bacterium]|nr:hypothetical protein [Deltaproteobacteria bacterium]
MNCSRFARSQPEPYARSRGASVRRWAGVNEDFIRAGSNGAGSSGAAWGEPGETGGGEKGAAGAPHPIVTMNMANNEERRDMDTRNVAPCNATCSPYFMTRSSEHGSNDGFQSTPSLASPAARSQLDAHLMQKRSCAAPCSIVAIDPGYANGTWMSRVAPGGSASTIPTARAGALRLSIDSDRVASKAGSPRGTAARGSVFVGDRGDNAQRSTTVGVAPFAADPSDDQ